MRIDAIWFYCLIVLITGISLCGAITWIQLRRRIASLDWPHKFQHRRTMRRYCKIFLKQKGWDIWPISNVTFELLAKKPPNDIAIAILMEKDYYIRIPDHFVTKLAL